MPSSQLTDFSDRLSPMLVKELRQGLRTNLFTTAFILLQGFMVLTVFIGASSESAAGAASGFFWTCLVVTLLIAMPIRGINALSAERQNNTLNLIQLTSLSAWRITFGKWAALVSQSTLLVISILPYLLMRYFFGGVDLVQEFLILFGTFFASALLTALAVGFSAAPSLLRGFVIMATGFFFLSGLVTYAFSHTYGGSSFFSGGVTSSAFWWASTCLILGGLYLIYFLLDFGASHIASQAENHATRKRLISLAFALLIVLLTFAGADDTMTLFLAAMAITLACTDAITERPSTLPSVLAPFSSNRIFSPTKYLLSPGWHTGIFFLLFSTSLFFATAFLIGSTASAFLSLKNCAILASIIGTITYPLIFIHLFFPNSKQMFALYVLIQCCTSVVTMIIVLIGQAASDTLLFYLPIPSVAFAVLSDSSGTDKGHSLYFLLASIIFTLISLAVPFWRALPLYKKMRRTA